MTTLANAFRSINAVLVLSLFVILPFTARAQDKAQPEKVRIAIATSSLAFLVPFVAKDRGFLLKDTAGSRAYPDAPQYLCGRRC